jgi:hypothetical protein
VTLTFDFDTDLTLDWTIEVEGEVNLQLTVSQSVYLSVWHPFEAHDQILFPFFYRKIALRFVLVRPL